ncbi:hypothetical protein [Burkholderia ubonensis]|uniref:hypothetical protein n=1 Tax=Burkholderia ubonensis TaxID=101571 RepID=UPI0007546363|nr:hypothetical protein [Burkholderia ubonensis]KVV07365.1 hypothetical protein WK77_16380 [Burkholderia ubonensis]
MSTLTHFNLHPGAFASVGVTSEDTASIVDCVLASSPDVVNIEGFDQVTAAAIADRLACLGVEVHVSGSGQRRWRTPSTVYDALLERIQFMPPSASATDE